MISPTELEGLIEARQKLEAQQQENKGVQGEFAALDEDANIYKLVGPVLLKQDKSEAVMAVNSRLEFIEKEMYVKDSRFPFCNIPLGGGVLFRGLWNKHRPLTDMICPYSKRIEGQIKDTQEESDKKRVEVRNTLTTN